MPSLLEEAQRFNDEGIIHFEQNKIGQAVLSFNKALSIYTQMFGDIPHDPAANTLINLANVFYTSGDTEHALSLFYQALEIKVKLYSNESEEVQTLYGVINNIKANNDNNVHSENHTNRDSEMINEAEKLNDEAIQYFEIGKAEDAITFFSSALTIYNKIYKEAPNNQTADTLINLGNTFASINDLENAIEVYNAALVIKKQLYSVNSEEVQSIIVVILSLKDRIHHHHNPHPPIPPSHYDYDEDEASHPHRQSSSRFDDQLEAEIALAQRLNDQGIILFEQNKGADAAEHFTHALDIYRRIFDDTPHDEVANTLINLGNTFQQWSHDTEHALEVFHAALEVKKQLYRKDDDEVVNLQLAIDALESSTPQQPSSSSSSSSRAVSSPPPHLATTDMEKRYEDEMEEAARLNDQGIELYELGRAEESIKCFTSALGIYSHYYKNTPHDETATTFINLANVFNTYGDKIHSLEFYINARDMRVQLSGENHEEVLALNNAIRTLEAAISSESRPSIAKGGIVVVKKSHDDVFAQHHHHHAVEHDHHANVAHAGGGGEGGKGGIVVVKKSHDDVFAQHHNHHHAVAVEHEHAGSRSSKDGVKGKEEIPPNAEEGHEMSEGDHLYEEGMDLIEQGKAEDAISLFEQALSFYNTEFGDQPHDQTANAMVGLANAFSSLGEVEHSVEVFRVALEIKSQLHSADSEEITNLVSFIQQLEHTVEASRVSATPSAILTPSTSSSSSSSSPVVARAGAAEIDNSEYEVL